MITLCSDVVTNTLTNALYTVGADHPPRNYTVHSTNTHTHMRKTGMYKLEGLHSQLLKVIMQYQAQPSAPWSHLVLCCALPHSCAR